MQKNLYFRTTLKRQNVLKNFLLDGFLAIASYPRLTLEVFVRRRFGQRYFSLASVFTVAVVMILLPVMGKGIAVMSGYGAGQFWQSYASWYVFVAAFLQSAWQRNREVKQYSSIFNFSMFSLYSGDIHPFFKTLRINGRRQSIRTIETLIEPGAFLLAGVLLILLGQSIGYFIAVSALAYSLSYMAAYKNGDNFIMDKIDEMLFNEELDNAFVEDMDSERTRGVKYYMEKPESKELRRKLAASLTQNDSDNSNEQFTVAA